MFDFRTIPLPRRLTILACKQSVRRGIAISRFGRSTTDVLPLYDLGFEFELATATDLCFVPTGWIESHKVFLPSSFAPKTKGAFKARLERMIHTRRDPEAINAILGAATLVKMHPRSKDRRRFRLIGSLDVLAERLARARTREPEFVDNLMKGRLGRALVAMCEEKLDQLDLKTARELLRQLAIMWCLHDLQVIASRCFQSIYSPTGFLEEGRSVPQSFAALGVHPNKWGEMAAIVRDLLLQKGQISPDLKKRKQKLLGFVAAYGIKDYIREYALSLGFTESDIDNAQGGMPRGYEGLEKVLVGISMRASRIGDAFSLESPILPPLPPLDSCEGVPCATDTYAGEHNASISAHRYGIEATTALAHSIAAFIHMAEKMDAILEHSARELQEGKAFVSGGSCPGHDIRKGHYLVIYEHLFAAYRAILVRDTGYLRAEIKELLPGRGIDQSATGIFGSRNAHKEARRDFLLGNTSSVLDRLGEADALTGLDGADIGIRTDYGRPAINAAAALLRESSGDGLSRSFDNAARFVSGTDDFTFARYDDQFAPALLWRLSRL